MLTPLIIWSSIVGLFLFVLVLRPIISVFRYVVRHQRIIEIGSERDEFYVPGDPLDKDDEYGDA